MARGSASDFLRILNEQNDRLAARKTDEETQREADVDQFQLQKDQERRERWGTLRAVEHPSKRPMRVSTIWGHTDLS